MTKKEINHNIKLIKDFIKTENEEEAANAFISLSRELHSEKKYDIIIESFEKIKKILINETLFYSFELAFAYTEQYHQDFSEQIYEFLNLKNPDNPAILNNLSNIKQNKRKFKEAFNLISTAYEIEPDDEVISNNYNSLFQIITELKEREQKYKHSATIIERENKFVIDKLKSFIQKSKKEDEYNNGVLPIPKWKFKILMQTDEQKAESLRGQWLDKEYITDTGDRGNYNEIVYEINPYLEKAISEIKLKIINPNWIKGIESLNSKYLNDVNYYRNLKKLNKVNKTFKAILKRDFDELTFNYIVKNNKSTIILAGSLIETLLIYYLNKKKTLTISYQINNRKISKNLYDATLNDLLQYLEENKLLEKHFVHLGNVARIFRNYVHPGKELRESEELDDSKVEICYITASELINTLI